MSLDGIAINVLAHELNNELKGGRIDKIGQIDNQHLLIQLRNKGNNHKLLISIEPQTTRMALTHKKYTFPQEPPLFCMVLRKHLTGAIIEEVSQIDWERMISLKLRARNDIGEEVSLTLLAELMGKNSNLILLNDEQIILDAMRRAGAHTNLYRQIQPGLSYVMPPPQNKKPLSFWDSEALANFFLQDDRRSKKAKRNLLDAVAGIGPQTTQELLYRAQIDPEGTSEYLGNIDYERLAQALSALKQFLDKHASEPTLVIDHQTYIAFAPFPLKSFTGFEQKTVDSMSALLEEFYQKRAYANLLKQKKSALERILKQEMERCHRKLSAQEETVLNAEKADIYRIYGELLTANLYQIKQSDSATVVNFYDPEQKSVEIPMNSELSPNENAQVYFKKYQKAKNGAQKAIVFLEQTQNELQYLKTIELALDQADNLNDFAEIRQELVEGGYIKRRTPKKRKVHQPSMQVLHITRNGYDIYVGKNNMQNDYVTQKIGRGKDLWLHTKDIHGAHVIVKSQGEAFPDAVIEDAALLAAWFSKARYGANVPVDMTLKKYVSKPNGARPGMVIYTDQETVFVTPSESRINEILEG